MDRVLRVLILEDVLTDSELAQRELRQAGLVFESRRVMEEAEFVAALSDYAPDLILADYSLPKFDGLSAVKLVQSLSPDVPVIIVSGTVGEEQAIETLKLGATDYVLKQRLERLGPVAKRALHEAGERRERRAAEAALTASEKRFRALIENSNDAISLVDAEGKVIYDSPAVPRILGPGRESLAGRSGFTYVHPDDLAQTQRALAQLLERPRQPEILSFRFRHADGSWRWIEAVATNLLDEPSVRAIVVNFRDVTERVQAEAQLRLQSAALNAASNSIAITDQAGQIVWVNPAFTQLTGYSAETVLGQNPRLLKSGQQETEFYHHMWAAISAGQVWHGEMVNRRQDGSLYTQEQTITPILADDGRITHYIAIQQDITARKQAEAQIQYLATVLENVSDGIVSTAIDGTILSWNAGAEILVGNAAGEVIGRPFIEVLPYEYVDREEASVLQQALETGRWDGEVRFRRKDGATRYVLVAGATIKDADGAVTGFSSVLHDITVRKEAEVALRKSEERFRSYFELGLIGIVITSPTTGILEANDELCKILGYERTELLNTTWVELTHPDDLSLDLDQFNRVQAGEIDSYTLDKRFIRKDGRIIDATIAVRCLRKADGSVDYFVALLQDITERKQAAAALIQTNDLLSRAEQIGEIGSWRWDIAADRVMWSEGLYRVFGLSPQEFGATYAAYLERVHPDDRERVSQAIDAAYRERVPLEYECRIVRADGEIKDFYTRADVMVDSRGNPVQLLGIGIDITERKRAETAVAASEAELRSLFAAMTDVVLVLDAEGRHLQIAPTNPGLLVKPPAELLGRMVSEVMPEEDASRMVAVIRQALETREPVRYEYSLPVDGATVWFDGTVSAMGPNKVFWISRDITERKQRERELEAIAAISTALGTADSQVEMLPLILEQVMVLVNAGGAALAMRDPSTNELVIAMSHGDLAEPTGTRLPPGAGIGGHVLTSGQPYVTGNVAGDPRWYQTNGPSAAMALACVPLITSQHSIGVLWAVRAASFSGVEVRVLSAIAGIAASAIQRAGLHEQTEQQVQRLAALGEIDAAIINSVDLRTTMQILLGHVTDQLAVDAADILLLSPGMQMLEYAAGRGFRSKAIERSRLRLGEGHAGRAALERRLVAVPDLRVEPTVFRRHELLAGEAFVAKYCAPLLAKGQVVGVLEVFHRAPLNPDADWVRFFETLAGQAAIAVADARLFADLQRSNTDMLLAYDTTLEGWSAALDLRDKETEGHSQRVTEMTLQLARALRVGESELEHIRRGALLHDIGKMGIPDSILHKPGKLTDDEWVIMRRHPGYAYELLSPIGFLRPALDIPYCHHEKWDGSGYPRQLNGDAIPLSARIFAVVDVWDALRSDRPYRAGWPEDRVLDYIRDESGKHFDPEVVAAFLTLRASGAGGGEMP